jgi:hypothetical protein
MKPVNRISSCEQADGRSRHPNGYHKFLKKRKSRIERRKAKANPECLNGYGRYKGWET